VFSKSVFLAAGSVPLSNQTRDCLPSVRLVAENGCSATVKGMYECSATICTENGGTHPHCGRLLYLDHAGLPVWPCKGRDERRFKPGFLAPSTLRPAQRSYRLCGWNGHLRSWPIASIQKFERACGTTWRECCAEFLKVSVLADSPSSGPGRLLGGRELSTCQSRALIFYSDVVGQYRGNEHVAGHLGARSQTV